jgi:hypothetical protein
VARGLLGQGRSTGSLLLLLHAGLLQLLLLLLVLLALQASPAGRACSKYTGKAAPHAFSTNVHCQCCHSFTVQK